MPALDQVVGLHLSQLLTQHFPGDAREHAMQLTEPARLIQQSLKEHRLPAAVDDGDGCVERAGLPLTFALVRQFLSHMAEGTSKCLLVNCISASLE